MSAKDKIGLQALRANLEEIFSEEGKKNLDLLRKGELSTLPPESFNPAPAQPLPDLTTEVHSDPTTEVATVATEDTSVVTSIVPSVVATEITTDVTTQPTTEPATHLPRNPQPSPFQGRGGLTANQTRIFDFLVANNPCKLSYKEMSAALGISAFSTRDVIYIFRDRGWLRMEKWRQGVKSGVLTTMKITHLPEEKPVIVPTSPLPSDPTSVATTVVPSVATSVATSVASNNPLLDRKKEKILSISHERMAMTWPCLTAAGFGPAQIAQIVSALTELDKPTDKIVQSLEHAEWELKNGKMVDKTGAPVVDPCSWVFRSLSRFGYYRKPAGYISPEEQALIDAEETAKAILIRQQSAQTAQFEAWRTTLTPEALEEAMEGYQFGPKDQWLKNYWRKLQGIQS